MPRSAATSTVLRTFGSRVRSRRLELGLSQEALAEAADLHPRYIGFVERAERSIGLESIVKLAGGLRIDPGTLVAGLTIPHGRQ